MSAGIQSNANIKISVIMPIYNAGEYLDRAIGDVLAQSFTDFEFICIDDGSTDNSPKIIKKYAAKDSRIRVISDSNKGQSIARNTGLKTAKGKYIIFLDADDFYEKNLLKELYETAERDELDIAVSKFDIYNDAKGSYSLPTDEPHGNIFTPGGVTSKNEHPDYILSSATGYVWNKLFRATFLKDKALVFDPALHVFEDVCFVCSALSLAERVGRIDDILIHHRVYSDQSRARFFREYYGQVPVVYTTLKKFLMARGMYVPLKQGFLNLSAGRIYKIYNILWSEGKEQLWNMLHDKYIAELEWLTHDKTAFESVEVCEFVANAALYTHDEYLSRTEQGKSINVEELEENEITDRVEKNKKISRRKNFFDRINIFKKR